MESSETSSSSDSTSSFSSGSSLLIGCQSAAVLNQPEMAMEPQMSVREEKMIDEAVDSLLNTLDKYRPRLTDTQYAYYCKYGSDYLTGIMEKKARKLNRRGMSNSSITIADASVAGSSVSGSSVLRHPLNQSSAQNLRYVRAPSVMLSIADNYTRQPAFEPLSQRHKLSVYSSGYSSGVPSRGDSMNRTGFSNAVENRDQHRQRASQQPFVVKSKNGTLMQAINESIEISSSPEQVQKSSKSKPLADYQNRLPRLEVPSTSSNPSESADSDHSIDLPKNEKVNSAVPKELKGVTKLIDWSIKLVGENLCVVGTHTTRENSQITSGTVLRYSHPSIITSKGRFLVVGQPCFGDRTPSFVKSVCSNGFPRQWRALSRRWYEDRQARRKGTPKKTPERKIIKNTPSSGSAIRRKGDNSASKATPSSAAKAKASKSTLGRKAVIRKPPKKNDPYSSSQCDKENKTAKRRSKSMETLKKDEEASSPDARRAGQRKRRSKSTENLNNGKSSSKQHRQQTDDSESDSEPPVAAKHKKNNPIKRRPNPTDDSDSDSPVAAKRSQPRAGKSRLNTDNESESGDDSSSTLVEHEANPKTRVLQERGSDTSWDNSKKQDTPTPKAPSKKVTKPNKAQASSGSAKLEPNGKEKTASSKTKAQASSGNAKLEPNGREKTASSKTKATSGNLEPKTNKKETVPAKPKNLGAVPKMKVNAKEGNPSSSNNGRPPATNRDGGSKKTLDIFGDELKTDGKRGTDDFFSELGGDDLFSMPYSRSMTPNTLVASTIQPDAGLLGRFTPPLQAVQHLFQSNLSCKTNSPFGSPSSLNNSRDNPVSKRMAKDVVGASKKRNTKKKKPRDIDRPAGLEDIVNSFKNKNNKTPTIVKKVFRNHRGTDDDDDESTISDKDESMAY